MSQVSAELLEHSVSVVTLATMYADGVVDSLFDVESEQVLREGLAGAFLSFLNDVIDLSKED